jgi:hypothetical protein
MGLAVINGCREISMELLTDKVDVWQSMASDHLSSALIAL